MRCGMLLMVVLIPLAGCADNTIELPTRVVAFDVQADDPAGVYDVHVSFDEPATIDEDLTIEVEGRTVKLDAAFLRNARVRFQHRGQEIPNAHYKSAGDQQYCWMIHRGRTQWRYFIGTPAEYARLAVMV